MRSWAQAPVSSRPAAASLAGTAEAAASPTHDQKGQPGGGSKVIPADRIGLQLFTVRGLVGTSLGVPGTVEVISDAGIRDIELAGTYYDTAPAELRTIAES